MLLIDDEADNASVNTRSEDASPAAINACIRKLLHEFYQVSYLGITATPFANIFINPETEDEMIGDDLFPRDFIYSLAPPTNYIGADKIFGDEPSFSDALIPLRRDEMDLFFPFTHKKDLVVDALPPSLYEAMAYFLLFNAIRDLRGDYRKNVKKLPGCPDIVLPKYKTVIFVNGCFWHKHDCPRFVWPSSNQDYWIPKIQRNIERDRLNAAELQKKGWHIITVWECELKKKNRELRLERLLSEITLEDFDNGTNQS